MRAIQICQVSLKRKSEIGKKASLLSSGSMTGLALDACPGFRRDDLDYLRGAETSWAAHENDYHDYLLVCGAFC
jgi:hypothetical protein